MADLKNGTTINGQVVWHAGNDGAGSGLDADKLDGMEPATAATPNTIVQRDAQGRIKAAAPSASDDVARKAETDAALSTAQAAHYTAVAALPKAGGAMTGPIESWAAHFIKSKYANMLTWSFRRIASDATGIAITPSSTNEGEDWDYSKEIKLIPGGLLIGGKSVWAEDRLRWNISGYLEYNDEGTWIPVASNKALIPSNNVRSANNPERTVSITGNGSDQYRLMLVHKWIPPFDGIVNLYGEIRVDNPNGGTGADLLIYFDSTAKSVASGGGISYVLTSQISQALWDYTTPIGTIYTGSSLTGMASAGESIVSTASTSYVSGTVKAKVFKGEPVFIVARFKTTANSGEIRTGYARNIQIKYDELLLQ